MKRKFTAKLMILTTDEVTGIRTVHKSADQKAHSIHTAIRYVQALLDVHGPYSEWDAAHGYVMDQHGRERWTVDINRMVWINYLEDQQQHDK
jgi:hypothetical protein